MRYLVIDDRDRKCIGSYATIQYATRYCAYLNKRLSGTMTRFYVEAV